MKKILNVGVIGIGMMGKNHLRILSELENVDLISVADQDDKELAKLEKKYSINTYSDYKTMLEKEKLDMISIAVPTSLHKKIAIDCIEKGINVLIEKPIASTIEEANEIIECAKKYNVKLMVGHIERFNPAIQELKKKINDGEIGKVYEIDIKRVGPFPTRISDVGVVIDLAVHDLDILRYIQESEPIRLYAEIEKKIHTDHEDLMCAMLKFNNSVIGNLTINWLTPTKKRKVYVTGEKGMFIVDYITQDLIYYENASIVSGDEKFPITEGKMIKFHIPKKEPLRNEIEHFIDCVVNDKEPLVSGDDAKMALLLAKKIIESANNNIIIKFNEK